MKVYHKGNLLKELSPEAGKVFYIGRGKQNDVVVGTVEQGVSRRHAKLELVENQWWLEDCDSPYGIHIDGRQISREALPDAIKVKLGSLELFIECEGTDAFAPDDTPQVQEAWQRRFDEAKAFLRDAVRRQLNLQRLAQENLTDEGLEGKVRRAGEWTVNKEIDTFGDFSAEQRQTLVDELVRDLLRLGPLEPFLADDEITEIMVLTYDKIYIEKNGTIQKTNRRFEDEQHLLTVIERIITPVGRRIDESSPLVDARLSDGSRVNAVIPPVSPDGAYLTIRKFGKDVFDINRLLAYGSLTQEMAEFLKICVQARKNIVVSGGTGSGKTSLLNTLSLFISEDERIVTIEDSMELKLSQEHVARLEARPPNPEGKGEISIRRLVKNTLRMRPDRIIVGECRGGEALDMLQAMNTGHDGSLTTVHANSPRDVMSRLETLTLMAGMDLPLKAVRDQIISAVDLIVHTSRLPDGSRKIVQITEVVGLEGDTPVLSDIFKFERKGIDPNTGKVLGEFVAENRPGFAEDLIVQGFDLKNEWFM